MYHVAFTPNTTPANALSAKAPTLLGAFAELLKSLTALDITEDSFVAIVFETAKQAIDNLENCQPAKGAWSDMGCEDDAFSIDIFTDDDAQYVTCDDHELLAPHGAIALVNGKLVTAWIYDEAELAEWKKDNEQFPTLAVAILIPARRSE